MYCEHGENLDNYIFTRMISRADVAHFVLKQITPKYLYKAHTHVIP
ncbi:hypothetical protein [Christiangramia sediminis]|uniref:Uncharacterized protein n=1 Tax=Christiangramia sediminis TaxID=2881336 RepID=A0A9X1RX39_9FLAO|nr:hypothetical protein [Christiangramia sediminis]MCB7482133.1 hypothetical protein [Christiangramia sediminis]